MWNENWKLRLTCYIQHTMNDSFFAFLSTVCFLWKPHKTLIADLRKIAINVQTNKALLRYVYAQCMCKEHKSSKIIYLTHACFQKYYTIIRHKLGPFYCLDPPVNVHYYHDFPNINKAMHFYVPYMLHLISWTLHWNYGCQWLPPYSHQRSRWWSDRLLCASLHSSSQPHHPILNGTTWLRTWT